MNEWVECLDAWTKHIYSKSQSASSAESHFRHIRRFLATHPDPGKVTRAQLENYINRLTEGSGERRHGKAPAAATRNARLGSLASFYKFAASFVPTGEASPIFQGFNPTAGVYYAPMPMVYRSLNEEELARLFAAIPDSTQGRRDRAFFLVLLLTLRRRSELLRLRWGDISRGIVSGEHGMMHQGYLYEYRTKGSGQRQSKSELPALAYRVITEYLAADGRLATIQPGDPIFIADASARGNKPAPGAPLAGSTLLRNLKKYAKAAGLEMAPCLHSFRHTGIQQRLKDGQQPLDIMRISGHKSMDNFYRYTMHLQGTSDPGASAIERKFAFLAE